jgi:hypothetical protein
MSFLIKPHLSFLILPLYGTSQFIFNTDYCGSHGLSESDIGGHLDSENFKGFINANEFRSHLRRFARRNWHLLAWSIQALMWTILPAESYRTLARTMIRARLHHAYADKDAVPYRFFNDVTAQALKNVERLVKDHLPLGTRERGDLKLLPHTQPHVQFWNLGSGKLHCTREEVIKEVSSQHYIHLCLYTTRLVYCGIGCYDI